MSSWDGWDREAYDRWVTTDPINQPEPLDEEPIDYTEMWEETCPHEFVSWHGSRGECQECGAIILGIFTEDIAGGPEHDPYNPLGN